MGPQIELKAIGPCEMDRLAEIAQDCRRVVDDLSLGAVRRWKEEHPDRKVFGHFQVYSPEEIAHAAGMLPITIAGGGNRIESKRASSRLPSFICSICNTSLEMALSGRLDVLDIMAFQPICGAATQMPPIWGRNLPNMEVQLIYLPSTLMYGEASVRYIQEEYLRLKRDLERLTGATISNDALKHSIQVYNDNRRLIRRLYALRRESPWLLSTAEVFSLLRVGSFIRKEKHNEILEDALREIPKRSLRRQDKIRVVLEGAFCEMPPVEFLQVLEEVCYIVDDDLLIGARWFDDDVCCDGDPLLALASSYVRRSPSCSFLYEGTRDKMTTLRDRYRGSEAEAVIFCGPRFCEPALNDHANFSRIFDGEKIPYLILEFEEKSTLFEQVRVQAETFVESLLFYRLTGDE